MTLTLRVGRPRILTDEVQAKVCTALRYGNAWMTAAAYAGISNDACTLWRRRGRAELQRREAGEPDNLDEQIFVTFLEETDLAIAEASMVAVLNWRTAMSNDWRACATWLARRHPDEWAERTNVQVTGPDGGPVIVESARERIQAKLAEIADRHQSVIDV